MSRDRNRSVLVALLVAGTFFMENLDGTIIATALPRIAESFGVAAVDLNIGMSAYLLTLAVFIPASGWLADRFGARTVLSWAIAVFTLASLLCAVSNSVPAFTAARVLQGLGGAMMVPVGRLAVLRNTEKKDLVKRIATITWPGLAAPVLGPPLGGFITTYADWPWIFLLNLPLGVAALAMTLRIVPNDHAGERRRFDGIGFLLTGGACFGFMYGLELVAQPGDRGWAGGGLLLGSLLLAALAVRHARGKVAPMLDLSALCVQTYRVTLAGGSLFRMAISAVPFLLPLMFQLAFGLDAFHSGLMVLAVFAGNLMMKPLTTPVLRRLGFRGTLLCNGLLSAATILACAFLTPQTPVPVILALLFVSGLARSMQFTALNTLAFADVPPGRMSGANTLFSAVQQMALGLGIALGAVVLRLGQSLHGEGGVPSLGDFRLAFLLVAALALLSLADVLRLPHDAARLVSGHQPGGARTG